MKLDYLKYVNEIARVGSINKAASALMISQPHLSAYIKELEQELGVLLFNRTNKGISLTPAGKEFIDCVIPIENALDRIRNLRNTHANVIQDNFSVANIYSFTFLDLFNDFSMLHTSENNKIFLCEMPVTKIVDEIFFSRSAIGFIFFSTSEEEATLSEFREKELSFHRLTGEPFCVVVNKQHPFFNRDVIYSDELINYSLVVDKGKTDFYRRTFKQWFQNNKQAPVLFDSNRSSLYYMTKAQNCFTMGHRSLNMTNPFVESGQLRYIPLADGPFEWITGYLTNNRVALSPLARQFCAYVDEYFINNWKGSR